MIKDKDKEPYLEVAPFQKVSPLKKRKDNFTYPSPLVSNYSYYFIFEMRLSKATLCFISSALDKYITTLNNK